MTSLFLAEAKSGLTNLIGHKSLPVSTRGSMADIRKKHKGYVEGNIKQYSLLGSQNAISKTGTPISTGTQTEFKPKKESSTETEFKPPPPTEAKLDKDAVKGTETKLDKDAVKQPEEKEAEPTPNAKEPAEKPPFDVSSQDGKQAFQAYAKYLAEKYTQKIAQIEIDKIYQESGAFSVAIRAINKMEQAIDRFNKDTTAKFAQWLNNAVSDLVGGVISGIADTMKNLLKGAITFGTGGGGIIIGELSGRLMDDVKGIIVQASSFKNDYVGNIQSLIEDLFSVGGRSWKTKYAKVKAEWEKRNKEIEADTKQRKEQAEKWLTSPEGKEYTKWEKDYYKNNKKINLNEITKKYNELFKKYQDRIKKERDFVKEHTNELGDFDIS